MEYLEDAMKEERRGYWFTPSEKKTSSSYQGTTCLCGFGL